MKDSRQTRTLGALNLRRPGARGGARGAVLFVLALAIVACEPVQVAAVPVVIITATRGPTAAPVVQSSGPDIASFPTAAQVDNNAPTDTPYPTTDFQSDIIPSDTPAPAQTSALAFDFGTQTPFPTLSWRPAPYPVPLSIRPEDHFWFSRPIASNAVNWPLPSYRYGSTYFGFMNSHTGVDLDSPLGTPVIAAGEGTVVWAGMGLYGVKPPEDDPYGNAVVVKHNFGYNGKEVFTVYAHMSEIDVWLNQPVKPGDLIGKVGCTGFCSGPHLHFEVRIGENKFRSTYNPELWLAPPTGWGVLVGRVLDADGNYIPELPVDVYDASGRYYPVVTYSSRNVNADPLYKENFVLSDLPAGTYKYVIKMDDTKYVGVTEITAGQSTFVIVQEGMNPAGGIPRTADPAVTNGPYPDLGTKRPPKATATYIAPPTLTPTP
jgi:murein DD-endopeptidase MepM/ murein hydrolase activator NlpD